LRCAVPEELPVVFDILVFRPRVLALVGFPRLVVFDDPQSGLTDRNEILDLFLVLGVGVVVVRVQVLRFRSEVPPVSKVFKPFPEVSRIARNFRSFSRPSGGQWARSASKDCQ